MSPPTDYRRPLPPPQFTLRTLILVVTVLAILFALVNVVHPIVLAGLVLLVLLIAAHVVGNYLGTRLREMGDRPVTKEGGPIPPRRFFPHVERGSFAPQSDLAKKISLGLPVLIVTSAGVLTGGIAGGMWGFLSATSDGWANIVVGTVAFGFLGGFASFAAFSFTQVILSAIWQASRPQNAPSSAAAQAENDRRYPL
jgi:hypothetical protein